MSKFWVKMLIYFNRVSYFGSAWDFIHHDPVISTNLSKLQNSTDKTTPPPSPTRKGAAPQSKLASGKNTGQVPSKATSKTDTTTTTTKNDVGVHEWNPKHGPYPRGSVVLHEGKVYPPSFIVSLTLFRRLPPSLLAALLPLLSFSAYLLLALLYLL